MKIATLPLVARNDQVDYDTVLAGRMDNYKKTPRSSEPGGFTHFRIEDFCSTRRLRMEITPRPRMMVIKMIIPHSLRVGISSEEIVVVVVGIVVVMGTEVVVTG